MAVYLLIGVILLMAPCAGVGVSHILIDLVNRLKFNEVSAGITVRKRDELDTESLLREVIQCLRLPISELEELLLDPLRRSGTTLIVCGSINEL